MTTSHSDETPETRATNTNDHRSDQMGDSDFVDPNDLTVQRDGEGNALPEKVPAGNLGYIKAIPMAYGDVQKRFGDGADFDVGPEAMADLFGEHIVEPDLDAAAREQGYDGLCAAYVEDMRPLVPRDLLFALIEVSGIDADVQMEGAGQANVRVDNPGN